jgi:feruloyl esterase
MSLFLTTREISCTLVFSRALRSGLHLCCSLGPRFRVSSPSCKSGVGEILTSADTADWFRYVIYNDPSWDPTTIGSDDYDNAARTNLFNIQTFNGNLSGVKDRGSKIIHWHGEADFIITSTNSPRYYEHVSATMGLSSSQLDDFYRFFRVSGTGHCGGGEGAHAIGQGTGEVNSLDPKENVLLALVDWVENGSAPETLIGTHWVNDTLSLGVDFQRAHCKYPKRNQYQGSGYPNILESWECVE